VCACVRVLLEYMSHCDDNELGSFWLQPTVGM